jgi:hypothetical protein
LIPKPPLLSEVELKKDMEILPKGTPYNDPRAIQFTREVIIKLDRPQIATGIDISLDNNDVYQIELLDKDNDVVKGFVFWKAKCKGMCRHTRSFENENINDLKVHSVRVTALSGDGRYSVGHIRLNLT